MSGLRAPAEGPACQAHGTTNSPGGIPRLLVRENTCPARHQTPILAIVSTQGELFRARTHIRASRATNIAHRTQKHGDVETNNTTARPQQGTAETAITFAPTNCTKNAHFSPAKAMAVSIPRRHQRAKATRVSVEAQPARAKVTGVSHHRAAWPTGPDCGTRGKRRHHRQPNLACNSIGRSFNNV